MVKMHESQLPLFLGILEWPSKLLQTILMACDMKSLWTINLTVSRFYCKSVSLIWNKNDAAKDWFFGLILWYTIYNVFPFSFIPRSTNRHSLPCNKSSSPLRVLDVLGFFASMFFIGHPCLKHYSSLIFLVLPGFDHFSIFHNLITS